MTDLTKKIKEQMFHLDCILTERWKRARDGDHSHETELTQRVEDIMDKIMALGKGS